MNSISKRVVSLLISFTLLIGTITSSFNIANAAGIWGNVSTLVRLVSSEGGSLSFADDGQSGNKGYYQTGETVTVNILPSDGYGANSISVSTEQGEIEYTCDDDNNTITFIKPDESIAVIVNFEWGAPTRLNEVKESNVESAFDYMMKHLNEEYVNIENINTISIEDAILVKHTLADKDKMNGIYTIDHLWEDVENGDITDINNVAFINQAMAVMLLYDVDSESNYYVGYANTSITDSRDNVTDYEFAHNNNLGEVVDDCIYDAETGLVYIPKTYSENDVLDIQVQLLHIYDINNTTANVNIIVHSEGINGDIAETGIIDTDINFDEIYIKLAKDDKARNSFDYDDLSVYVNGDDANFSYDSSTGILAVAGNAVSTDSIEIYIKSDKATNEVAQFLFSTAESLGMITTAKAATPGTSISSAAQTITVSSTPVVGDYFLFNFPQMKIYPMGKQSLPGKDVKFNSGDAEFTFHAATGSGYTQGNVNKNITYIQNTSDPEKSTYNFIDNGNSLSSSSDLSAKTNAVSYLAIFAKPTSGNFTVKSNGRTYTYDGWYNNTGKFNALASTDAGITSGNGGKWSTIESATQVTFAENSNGAGWSRSDGVGYGFVSKDGTQRVNVASSYVIPLICAHVSQNNIINSLYSSSYKNSDTPVPNTAALENTDHLYGRVLYVDSNTKTMYIGYISANTSTQAAVGIVKYNYNVPSYYSGISIKKAGSISGTETGISGAATFAVLETTDSTHITAGMIAEARNFALQEIKAGRVFNYKGSMSSHWSSTFSGQYMPSFNSYTSTNGSIVNSNITETTSNSTRYYWVFELTPPARYTLNTDIYRVEIQPTTSSSGAGTIKSVTCYKATDLSTINSAVSTSVYTAGTCNNATYTDASGTTLALLTIKNEEIPIYFDAAKAYSDGGAVAEQMYFKNYYRYKKEGAVYQLEIYNCNSSHVNEWLPLGTGVTNKDGKIEWTGLNVHATNLFISATDDKLKLKIHLSRLTGNTCTLRVTEITPPPGYTKATGSQSISKFSSDYSMTFDSFDSPLYDYSKKVSLHLEKSLTGYNLSDFNGAEFDLYMTPFHNNALTEGIDIVSTSNTRTPSIKSDTKSGYYYDDIIYKVGTFKIENGNIKATANPIYWKYVINTSANAQNTSANNHELFENNVAVNTYVHGAYIGSDGKRTTSQSAALSTTASVVTDTNGNQHFEKLPLGSYMLIETKSPTDGRIGLSEAPYYTWSADDITADENDARVDDDYSFTHTFNVVETPNGVTLGIKKVKEDPSIDVGSIEGAEYTLLYNKDSDPEVSNRRRTKNSDGSVSLSYDLNDNTTEEAVFVIGSDGIGKIKGTNDTIYTGEPGRYMFIETKAPKNYKFDTSIETVYVLSAGDSLTSDDIVSREPVHKDPLALSLEKTSNSSKPMTGAEFTVQFYEGAQELTDIVGKDPSRVLIYTINSDNAIDFRADNPTSGIMYNNNRFPIGLGVITETKAPDGYDISTNWTYNDVNYYIPNTGVVFSIRENSTNTEAKSHLWNGSSWISSNNISSSLNVDEPLETGKFNFTKYLDGTTRVLPNVSFNLYYSITEPNISNYSTTMSKLTTTVKTGTDGKYQSDNLDTGWYVLEEVRCDANKGMTLISPIKFEITKGANKNLDDSSTIINYQPSISTQEWDGDLSTADYKTHMSNPDNDVKIVDRVNYSNLENKTYTMKAIIMDITDNTAKYLKTADQKTIQAQKSFIANSDHVDVNFASFSTEGMYVDDTQLNTVEGRKFVIYEFLFEGNQEGIDLTESDITNLINNTGNVENAVKTVDGYVKHADMSDINQIGYFPEIHTLESDTKSLNHVSVIELDANNKEKITVKDVLTYSNLDTNLTYTIRVQVREKSTNTIIKEDTSKTFKPTTSNDTYTINDLTFEAVYGPDNTPVDEFYITEELFVGPITDNKLAASHTLPIEDQSGMVARIRTFATTNVNTGETENDIKSAYASKNVTLTDTLYYKNLNNETYTIECVYKYVGGSKDGQIVKDATDTKELRVRKENVKLSDGSTSLTLTGLNLTHLKDETIMAYETIYWTNSNNETIAIAKEINFDANQSVKFVAPVIRVNKVDQFGNGISGATLEIRKDTENGQTVKTIISKTTATIIDDLVDGTYYLVETKSPSNYSLNNESIKFVIDGGVLYINGEEVDTATITMVNYNLAILPTAGGIGTLWFTLSGLILMLGAILVKKKYIV